MLGSPFVVWLVGYGSFFLASRISSPNHFAISFASSRNAAGVVSGAD